MSLQILLPTFVGEFLLLKLNGAAVVESIKLMFQCKVISKIGPWIFFLAESYLLYIRQPRFDTMSLDRSFVLFSFQCFRVALCESSEKFCFLDYPCVLYLYGSKNYKNT